MPQGGWTTPAERVRGRLAPLVALLASSLLMCCLVTLPDQSIGWPGLGTASARFVGWAGFAVVLAMATALVSVGLCARLGSGPPLALGTTAAVLGLALSGDVSSGAQVVLVLVLLALGVGGLFGSGLCLLEELSPGQAQVAVVGWLLPWLGGWGLVGWLALHGHTSDRTRIGLHPPAAVLAAGVFVLLVFAVATLMLEPHREPAPQLLGWENAWAALSVLVVGAASLVMLLGYQPDLAPSWGRPVVLLSAAVGAAGVALVPLTLSDPGARPAYLALVVALATGPACLHALLLVSAEASGPLSWWLPVMLALAGAVGVWAGWRAARTTVPTGLLLMTASVAGGWVMPANEWVMSAAAAPLCLGIAMAGTAGLRLAASDRMRLRFVSIGALSGLLLGQVAAAPVAWALGAEITGTAGPRAGGRVLLGLTFALTVLAAGACAVLQEGQREHVGETVPPPPVVTPG